MCFPPALYNIYFIHMWHDNSLFVLKVPLNTNKPNQLAKPPSKGKVVPGTKIWGYPIAKFFGFFSYLHNGKGSLFVYHLHTKLL